MKYPNQPPGVLASVLTKLIKPAPIVPLTRSDFAKAHKRTTDHLRDTLNAQHPSSNPLLKDHFTNLGAVSSILSGRSTDINPPTANDLRQKLRAQLSTSLYPMSQYVKLKSSGELTKDTCRAVLFNSNLASYDDINTIATENCIPASYVVAKLMKLPNRSTKLVSEWMKKVPSIEALFEYIHQLDRSRHLTSRSLRAREDCRASLQQCHMDLTAHLTYILSTKGVEKGYKEWDNWIHYKTSNLSSETNAIVLQLPTLQLLNEAMLPPISYRVINSVIMHKDIELPPQRSLRRNLVSVLMNRSSSIYQLRTAMTVMDISRNSFEPEEVADYTDRMLRELMQFEHQQRLLPNIIRWLHSFLEKSIHVCQDVDFERRAMLARLKADIEGFERRRGSNVSEAGLEVV